MGGRTHGQQRRHEARGGRRAGLGRRSRQALLRPGSGGVDADFPFDNGFGSSSSRPPARRARTNSARGSPPPRPARPRACSWSSTISRRPAPSSSPRGPSRPSCSTTGDPEHSARGGGRVAAGGPRRLRLVRGLQRPGRQGWLLQEIKTRLPAGSTGRTTYASAEDLASAIRRAADAHGEHEKRIGAGGRGLARLVRRVHGGGAGRDGAADVNYDYDVIVIGGGLARRALRGRAGRGRAARRRRRARAGRRRVLLLGLHPVQVAAAARRGGAGARDAAASAEVDVEAALAWRDFMVSGLVRRRPGALAGRQGHRPAPRQRPARRHGRRRGRRRAPHRRARGPRDAAPIRSSRPSRACASSTASGAPARRRR